MQEAPGKQKKAGVVAMYSEKNKPSVNRFMRSSLGCKLFCFHTFSVPVSLPVFLLWYAASKAWIRSTFIL